MADSVRESMVSLNFASIEALFWFLFVSTVVIWIVLHARSKPVEARRQSSPDLEKPTKRERPYGTWIASTWKRPNAVPYPNWDVYKTEPLPYRPFKWGAYRITMGIKALPWNDWIELDNRYAEYHIIKKRRIEERGDKCNKTAPEAYDAAIELLDELVSYLPQRYPTLFRRTPTGIHNLLTSETFNTTIRPLPENPMQTCGRLIQDDLALLLEKPDGQYYLLGGSVLLPGFWRLTDKFGMPLSEIHTSGDVPGYRDKLQKPMETFFRRIKPENPVVRNNYFVQVDDDIAWSTYTMGNEDDSHKQQIESWNSPENQKKKIAVVDKHHFRSERQTLSRLPISGAIVFTIRTYFEPLRKIAEEPGVPGRLASAIRSWGEDSARYKGREMFGEVVCGFLDGKHREQVERGVVGENGEEVVVGREGEMKIVR